jgi:hypothetical protein
LGCHVANGVVGIYQTSYKVTTQHTPYELVYGTKFILPIVVPTYKTQRQLKEDLVVALFVRMENLALIDKLQWEACDNMDYI